MPDGEGDSGQHPPPIRCVLIVGGQWHDMDFARLQLLQLLAEDERVRTRVFEDFEHVDAIAECDLLISYTCNVVPSADAQAALRRWLDGGGRWYALHGTNSILRMLEDGRWDAPRAAPVFMRLLGSQFLSHPAIEPYRVIVVAPDHPLVAGIAPFETRDELYHMEMHGPVEVLLAADCTRPGTGFAEGDAAPGRHPVCYIRDQGAGAVLYLTLGHCRGHYDMRPLLDHWPSVDRWAWDLPAFRTLLRRGVAWAKRDRGSGPT